MSPYALHTYRDYAEYVRHQVAGNAKKLSHVWVREATIAYVAAYLPSAIGTVARGLCHGTRGGQEQAWFRHYLPGCEVLGTEIAPTAVQFPHTIQWDFHETKPDWLGAYDFIYSNSWDHAYDPAKALTAWFRCLRPGGVCVLEYSSEHGPAFVTPMDPFGIDLPELLELIGTWGAGRAVVHEVLEAPRRRGRKFAHVHLIIIRALPDPETR